MPSLICKSSKILIGVSILAITTKSFAAACCGGGGSSTLISGDQRYIFASSYSHRSVLVDNIDNEGMWYKNNQHVQTQALSLAIQSLIGDRWQAGGSTNILQKNYGTDSGSGVSDLLLNGAYELNPEFEASANPRLYLSGFLQLATGKTPQESQQIYNSFGDGFNKLGVGISVFKMLGRFDFGFSSRWMTSYAQNKNVSGTRVSLKPGNTLISDFFIGRAFAEKQLTLTLSQFQEEQMRSDDPGVTKLPENYTTAALAFLFPLKEMEMLGISYSNQTWLGNPKNTSLGESWAIVYTKSDLR